MKKLCLIYSGGEYCRTEEAGTPELVIACDRGLDYAVWDGVIPDLVLGDFDSCEVHEFPESAKVLRYPKEKDDTDTMLAVKYALEHGYGEIMITCALGARLDHTLANIQAGVYIAERGGRVTLLGRDDRVYVFSEGSVTLPKRDGWSLSVLSLSDRSEGVCLRGVRYPAEDIVLVNGFPLGVSNEWAADSAEISVASGVIMVMESKLKVAGGELP